MTTVTQKVRRASRWTESTWLEVSDHVAGQFGLTEGKRQALQAKKIARLIASIPYLANCDEPFLLAQANLGHYVMSCGVGKNLYAPTPENSTDVFGRLSPAQYKGGDHGIILRGMSLIALNMIADYKRDVEHDRSVGKYNPVGEGDWDFVQLRDRLLANVEAVDCAEMDEIIDVHTIMNVFWNYDAFPDWF